MLFPKYCPSLFFLFFLSSHSLVQTQGWGPVRQWSNMPHFSFFFSFYTFLLIQSSGGDMWCTSHQGEGRYFLIYFTFLIFFFFLSSFFFILMASPGRSWRDSNEGLLLFASSFLFSFPLHFSLFLSSMP